MPQPPTCTTTQRRRQERNSNTALQVPTVPTVADPCTAGWLATDILLAEMWVNRVDQLVYSRGNTGIFQVGGFVVDQTRIVGKGGNVQHTTITAALNSIIDATAVKIYNILVFAGVYSETITMKPFVNIIGMGNDSGDTSLPSVVITQVDATILTPANSCVIQNCFLQITAKTAARSTILYNAAAALQFFMVKDCIINFNGFDASDIAVSLTSTGDVLNNVIFVDTQFVGQDSGNGTALGLVSGSNGDQVMLDRCRIDGTDVGITFSAQGNSLIDSGLSLKNCTITATTTTVATACSVNNTFVYVTMTNTALLTGNLLIDSTAATRTASVDATFSFIESFSLAVSGGTEQLLPSIAGIGTFFNMINTQFYGNTTSAANAAVADLPNNRDFSIHRNTVSGNVFLAYNNSGANFISTINLICQT